MSSGIAADATTGPDASDADLTRWLRAVLWGAFLLPTVLFVAAGSWGYDRAQQRARDMVLRASALAASQAERSLTTAEDIASRINQAVQGDDATVHAHERELHQRLDDLTAGLPSVENANVWSASGRHLVGSDTYPVTSQATAGDRAYFIAQRDATSQRVQVSDPLRGRLTGRELFNVTIRRIDADGRFAGVVAVSMSPDYFREFYRTLANEQPELTIFTLVNADTGAFLARAPARTDGRPVVDADNPIRVALRNGATEGVIALQSTDAQREHRLVAFRAIPGFPLYATAGISRSAMLRDWVHFLVSLAAVYLPTTLGLVAVSWLALRRARRELALAAALREQVSRRATAEAAMLEAQKLEALSQVTGGVAHDFNNLLTILNTSLHVLRRSRPDLAGNRHVESMGRAIKSGMGLTRQLLSFSRKRALRPESIALQRWLPAMAELLRSSIGRAIKLTITVSGEAPPILVDAAELELALINLALNARHAMPDGGTLVVSVDPGVDPGDADRQMVVVRVTDNGSGIPDDLQSRVFEPFFTTRGADKGTGLGLSQVQGLCQQSGGFATIRSQSGVGTTVEMWFPPSPMPAAEAEPLAPMHELTGRILLVEDNDAVASVTESLLRSAGLEVHRVSAADTALAVLEAGEQADLVFSDLSMPGSIDGIGLAFALRERWPALPVLLTTGYASRIEEAVAAGFPVLNKPAPPDTVLAEIAKLLG